MEVCVDSVQSAINAAKGGATRLELCSALSEGGLTPTPGLLKAVSNAVSIPVYCMLRIRGGNNFVFSQDELEAMKTDALLLRAVGRADGFVFGALTDQYHIDVKACQAILQVTAPLPVTFHRAIDVCIDPLNVIQTIAELGFKRILTSGQKDSALEGIPLIKQMVERAGNQVSIMVGAGVRKENVAYILEQTNATEFHGSAKASVLQVEVSDKPRMGPSNTLTVTDANEVASTVEAARSVLSRKY